MIILFMTLWALMFGACLIAIAATPTTVVTPTSSLIGPLIWTGVLAGVATVFVAGILSFFS